MIYCQECLYKNHLYLAEKIPLGIGDFVLVKEADYTLGVFVYLLNRRFVAVEDECVGGAFEYFKGTMVARGYQMLFQFFGAGEGRWLSWKIALMMFKIYLFVLLIFLRRV